MYSPNPTKLFKIIFLLVCFSAFVNAQSTNSDFPTPVTTNEINGKIAARDIGDPRPTRYFYTFIGTPGDLDITIESENLNGDVDIFTVNNLRPLAKINLFETGYGVTVTANIYLRKREPLLLRIEAKPVSEKAGTFRIAFSGGFEAMADTGKQPEEPTVKTKNSDAAVRVNSVGARIEEPKPPVKEKPVGTKTETAKTTTPKTKTPTPAKTSTTTKTPTTTQPNTDTTASTTTPNKETPAARRKRLAAERAEAIRKRKEEEAAERKRQAQEKSVAANNAENQSSNTATNNSAKNTASKTSTSKPTPKEPTPDPMASVRLVVETKDGQRIERTMNEVRRVNVEKGVLVIVFMDGKIERIPMTNVQKMAIEPIF